MKNENKVNEIKMIPEFISGSSTYAVMKQQTLKTLKRVQGLSNFITTRGFTLIELLVVVLIIGILAAVALPQYNKAILKSRYTQAVTLAEKINSAQQIYYLEHNQYSTDFDELNIDMPAKTTSKIKDQFFYKWGYCWLHNSPYFACYIYKPSVAYVIFPKHQRRYCWAYGEDNLNAQAFCQAMTHKQTGNVSGVWTQYAY